MNRKIGSKASDNMIAKAISYSLINQMLLVIVMFGSVAVLGRLIEPSVFGVFALLVAIHSLLFPIVDLGLTPAFVKLHEVTPETKDVFFTINVFAGLIYGVVFIAIAPFVEQENFILYSLIYILSVLIISINQQSLANLIRNNNQKKIMFLTFFSTLVSVFVAILFAYYNFNIYALLAQQITQPLIMFILLKVNDDHRYKIKQFKVLVKYKSNIIFSMKILSSRIINGISLSFDKFLISSFFGVTSLGYYTKSFQLAIFPNANIGVALSTPIFSFIARKSKAESKELYPIIGNFIFFISGNLSIFLIVYGDWLIEFLLGDNWRSAGVYLQTLGLWGVGRVLHGVLIIIYTNENKMGVFSIYSMVALMLNFLVFMYGYYISKEILDTIFYFSMSNLIIWLCIYMYTMYEYSLKIESLIYSVVFYAVNSFVFYGVLYFMKYKYFLSSDNKWLIITPIYLVALLTSFLFVFAVDKRLLLDIKKLRN